MTDSSKIKQNLKDKGFKLTNQRIALIEVLLEHKNHFISAEEIHQKVKDRHPKTNFSTIYRNLEVFEEVGIIHKTNIMDGASIYELVCQKDHHHHIICKKCGKTKVIDLCPIDEISKGLKEKGFVLTDHKFELYGYCKKCTQK